MKITLNNIHHYLMHRGILSSADVLDNGFKAKRLPDARKLFQAESGTEHFFIKQIDEHSDAAIFRLQRDATCLYLLNNTEEYKAIRPYIAKYFGYHSEYHAMVTSFFDKAANMDIHYRKVYVLPDKFYNHAIQILKHLHINTESLIHENHSLQFFPKRFPWVLNLTNHPKQPVENASNGMERTIQHIIRDERLRKILEQAREPWKISSLIHGDIKFTNFMVDEKDEDYPIKIIDWEYADLGDPFWDLAGLFQNLIFNKVLFHFHLNEAGYVKGDLELEVRTALPLVGKLWKLYLKNHSNQRVYRDDALRIVLQFAMARLMQTAIELNQMDMQILVNTQRVLDTSIFLSDNLSWIMNNINRSNEE